MKRLLIGVVVLLSTQFCTSELNEIDGVVGDHVDSNMGGSGFTSIPSDSFLGQYFSSKSGDGPISSRIENRIRHDFNSPVMKDVDVNELSAKWTGNFYFETGNYSFTVNSDKDILFKIDNKVVLSDEGNSEDNVHTFDQQLDGVHQIVVEYNLENESTSDPVDNTTPTEPVDNTSTDPVDNTTPTNPVDNTTPVDPVDNTIPIDPVDNSTPSEPVVNNLTVNAKGTDGSGKFAHFIVMVDGQEIGEAYTTSAYMPYMFTLPKDPNDIGEIHIVHDNDAQGRDLYVESIELNERLIPATFENMTYQRTNEVIVDYYTGKMPWNGSLIFNITKPVDNTTPSDPVDNATPADPVVEVDNGSPTVEVDWEPANDNAASFFEGFEDGLRWNDPWWQHPNGEGIYEVVENPTASGSKALRMYLEKKKYGNSSNARCHIEFSPKNGEISRYPKHFSSRGTKFALYVPSDFQPDPVSEIVFQLHGFADDHDTYTTNPAFYIGVIDSKFVSVVRTIQKDPSHEADKKKHNFTIADVKPGHWHYFVVDTHWDYRENGNGYHRVYMKVDSPPKSSDLALNYIGPTGYNDQLTSYTAFNIYKFYWARQSYLDESTAAGVTHREYYFDDIEIKDSAFFSK